MNMKLSRSIDENIKAFKEQMNDCADIKMIDMHLGKDSKIHCFIAYIEVTLDNTAFEKNAIGRMVNAVHSVSEEEIAKYLDENAMGISDVAYMTTIEDAILGMLTGDAIMFFDGYDKALKISDKGYPGMSVQESDSEKVIRGSNESFNESVKVNTALIRKRIRTSKLKVQELKKGVCSNTNINVVYIEGIAYPHIVQEIKRRIEKYEIDGVMDSGVIEQLAEKKWYSPFPQFQTTRRPDMAAMAILEGRIVVLSDNSPIALILPTNVNSFLKTTDDYYNRFEVATFARLIRYVAAFLSLSLPGLYLAVTNFHTQILPTSLLLSFWQNRMGVPFPEVVEVLLMELSFELLREAGIRLPGAMGNTIGIVGGLIIGQAAVDANLVSPIVVIIVAFTALCSFAIPSEEFAFSFRILKFFIIVMSAWLGYFGFLMGLFIILIHLSRLKSFGIPYLMPFVGADLSDYQDEGDSVIRAPFRKITKRPIYAKRNQRTKLKKKE